MRRPAGRAACSTPRLWCRSGRSLQWVRSPHCCALIVCVPRLNVVGFVPFPIHHAADLIHGVMPICAALSSIRVARTRPVASAKAVDLDLQSRGNGSEARAIRKDASDRRQDGLTVQKQALRVRSGETEVRLPRTSTSALTRCAVPLMPSSLTLPTTFTTMPFCNCSERGLRRVVDGDVGGRVFEAHAVDDGAAFGHDARGDGAAACAGGGVVVPVPPVPPPPPQATRMEAANAAEERGSR